MKFQTKNVAMTPEILKRELKGAYYAPISIAESEFASTDVVKAGSPIGADGTIKNTSAAIGILLNDVSVDNPNGSLIRGFAVVNLKNANANSGLTIAEEVKTALSNIIFE